MLNGNETQILYFVSKPEVISIVIPAGVTEILPCSFAYAIYLIEVIFPDPYLKKIDVDAFVDCINLRRVVFPNSLETIEPGSFKNCTKIKCGGVVLKKELVEQAKAAGIAEEPLSDWCLNNLRELIKKPTCIDGNIKPLNRKGSLFLGAAVVLIQQK